jgi:tetratricopeptide (TPR) repeat protein
MGAFLLAFCFALVRLAAAAEEKASDEGTAGKEKSVTMESLFLDYSKTELGPLSTTDSKRKYLYTIQLEKSRLTHKLLKAVYDNAYELYRQGDYDGARELSGKILHMDPSFQDAAVLHQASAELKGTSKPFLSGRQLVEDRFEEGMALYRSGRLMEASKKWEESVQLSPGNLKARYWLKKVRGELADEHFRRGQKAYRQHRLRDSLDQWYAALVLDPKYPRLVNVISKAEMELRREEANEKLQQALNLYGQGDTNQALKLLDEVLKIEPGEEKAQKLIAEIRLEIATQHVAQGRTLYKQRQYTQAITEWNKAVEFGYDPRRANVLIARARNQMRIEAEEKRRRAEEAKRREEAEQRRAEEEARRKAEEEAAEKERQAQQAMVDATPPPAEEVKPEPTSEDQKRQAIKHWHTGIIYFQKGDYAKARDEWLLCKQFDATNADCLSGLQRIDSSFGGP